MRGLITQILTAASIAGAAEAAPWTQAEGDWYGRALIARDPLDGAEGWRADLYGEYGISDRWTLTAKSEAVTYSDFTEFDREALRLSVRRQLLKRGNWELGAEAAVLEGGARRPVWSAATGSAPRPAPGLAIPACQRRSGLSTISQTLL